MKLVKTGLCIYSLLSTIAPALIQLVLLVAKFNSKLQLVFGILKSISLDTLFSGFSSLPYFFGYKTEFFFFFQNNPKDLDPSCKTDLDLLDYLGSVQLVS